MLTSGKDKAARVPLDYFRAAGKRKLPITLIVSGVVVAALLASLASGYWRNMASPGKVHFVHAAWEQDCAVCHLPMQPTSSRNGLQTMMGVGKVSDDLCRNCHTGPPHHTREIPGDPGTCASCHMEHRGRDSMLAKPDDSSCIRCHTNLSSHVQGEKTAYEVKITRFDRDHPQFSLGPPEKREPLGTAKDPSKLKFNHKAHLTSGVRYSDKDAAGWTLGHIKDKALRERYRNEQPAGKKEDKDLVQLTCASCHQLDAADAPKAGPGQNLPARSAGEYMLPATYEQHCKACHPLTFDPRLPDVEAPHLLQPAELKSFLWGVYTSQEVKALQTKLTSGRPLPGLNISREEQESRKRIADATGAMEKFFFQDDLGKASTYVYTGKTTCGLCHEYGGSAGDKTPKSILPPQMPQVWYPHSKFSHRPHRTAQCVACHAGAEKSEKNTDVLLPGIENCRTCHAPITTAAGKPQGGVRYECTTCHRYHNGEAPEAGLGAKARGVKDSDRRTLQGFLDGK